LARSGGGRFVVGTSLVRVVARHPIRRAHEDTEWPRIPELGRRYHAPLASDLFDLLQVVPIMAAHGLYDGL
jgi:hypothetical protein